MHCRDEATFERVLELLAIDRNLDKTGDRLPIPPNPHDSTTALDLQRNPAKPTPAPVAASSSWGDFRTFVRALERIRHSLDPKEILHTTATEVCAYLNLDRVAIVRLTPELRGQFVAEAKRDGSWPNILAASPADETAETLDLAHADELAIVTAISESGGRPGCHPHLEAVCLSYLERFGVQSIELAPILCQGVTWGLLIAAHHQEKIFGARSRETLQQVGWTVGSALDHADLLEQTRSQTRKLATTLQALQQTQTQLIQNEKMASLGQLVAGIAHELNNPVNFIYGNISYIRDYTEDLLDTIEAYQAQFVGQLDPLAEQLDELEFDFIRKDLPRLVTSMHNGITRIRKIVSSLRTFSRLDEAEVKTIDIHSGIDSVLLLLRHRCRATDRRPEVTVECHYGHLPPIVCYPAALNQVFVNILSNSFDALAQASDEPRISIATTCLDGDRVAIAIRDNGCGIHPDDRDRIFDPFFTTKPPGQGTGLGLSVSYQIIVENHDGQLHCESELGQGTMLTLELPIDGTL